MRGETWLVGDMIPLISTDTQVGDILIWDISSNACMLGGMSCFKQQHHRAYALLAQRLREAREAVGLTQADAAEAVGKPQSYISKVELGERRLDVIELKVLANVYRKQLSFFDITIE